MAATGYTPISLYYSATAAATPTAPNLVAGELALNTADGKLYFKNSSNVVTLLASTPPTIPSNYVPFGNGTVTLQSSVGLQFNGTTLRVGSATPLGGTSNPIVSMTGVANNYIQSYIYNESTGTSASSDFVAYADNSTDAHGWADMGFTSSTYADSVYTVTVSNEAYLFGSAPSGATASGNFVFATDSTGVTNYFQWYVGGFTQAKTAWAMQLTDTGLQVARGVKVRAQTATSTSTLTVNADEYDQSSITFLNTSLTIAAPTGTPIDGQKLTIRIGDNGTSQTLTWTTTSGGFRVIGTTLPAATVASKTVYVGSIYNAYAGYWDVVSVAQEG